VETLANEKSISLIKARSRNPFRESVGIEELPGILDTQDLCLAAHAGASVSFAGIGIQDPGRDKLDEFGRGVVAGVGQIGREPYYAGHNRVASEENLVRPGIICHPA
jgi:hypothetical protein